MNPSDILIKASARFHRQYPHLNQIRDLPSNPFPLTWSVDILPHGRSQLLIIASEEHSLYTMLIPVNRSKDADNFFLPFQKRLAELFPSLPLPVDFVVSNRNNRQVIGSQNELLLFASLCLEDTDKPATPGQLEYIEKKLNSTILSYLNHDRPREAFSRLMEKL